MKIVSTIGVVAVCLIITSIRAFAQTEASGPWVGYVVDATGGAWEAVVPSQTPRALGPGSGLRPGDTVRLAGGAAEKDVKLNVVIFSTGTVVGLAPGASVPSPQASATSIYDRLLRALQYRVDKESLAPIFARGEALATDTALAWPLPDHWDTLFPGLAPGVYTLQFHRLDPEGKPVGDWTPLQEMTVENKGVIPRISSSALNAGLWQVAIRDKQEAGSRGAAWVLFTTSKPALSAFRELDASLTRASSQDAQLESTAIRLRRAALLELASTKGEVAR